MIILLLSHFQDAITSIPKLHSYMPPYQKNIQLLSPNNQRNKCNKTDRKKQEAEKGGDKRNLRKVRTPAPDFSSRACRW